jgi:hypothetical protein
MFRARMLKGPLTPAGEICTAGRGYLLTNDAAARCSRGSLEAWLCRAIAAITLHLENNAWFADSVCEKMTAMSTHTRSFVFLLDDEHRNRIGDCVRKDDIQLNYQGIVDFAHNIETSIVTFLKAKANTRGSYRQARDALRDLWRLSHEADDDISVRLLRARLLRLPKLALDYLDMRARLTSPELFDSVDFAFLAWAEKADAEKLVEMIHILSADGARLVSRSRGKRSRASLEPVIWGQAPRCRTHDQLQAPRARGDLPQARRPDRGERRRLPRPGASGETRRAGAVQSEASVPD